MAQNKRKLTQIYADYIAEWKLTDRVVNFQPYHDLLTSARAEDCSSVPHMGILHSRYRDICTLMLSILEATPNSEYMSRLLEGYERMYAIYSRAGGQLTWSDFKVAASEMKSTQTRKIGKSDRK